MLHVQVRLGELGEVDDDTLRPDAKCHVRLAGTDVYIQTWTYSQSGDVLVGSAYPDWDI